METLNIKDQWIEMIIVEHPMFLESLFLVFVCHPACAGAHVAFLQHTNIWNTKQKLTKCLKRHQ